ncbi:hypothetical protein KG487_002079 [Salmonella enterica subsp. enterica serovar 4,5,12:b:-]|nr:hypothetical protein [Salmonella enterica subsp. enterica]ECJ0732548.1 hypothetical protein [Salmonella enterica]EHF1447841.1 hypothetical protein [Salmonella enterica subsp. enterica serovar 4,5,12:b:-]EHG1527451.1 hypothetical protein [Salmonella enterica subsp. enterica serovar 4,[5],12:b:-]ECW3508356.1 hypothetical protein [Salmonella enterica]
MNILNIEGFRQIPPEVELYKPSMDDIFEKLKRYGVSLFSQCSTDYSGTTSIRLGTQVIDAVEYTGLKVVMPKGDGGFRLHCRLPDLRQAAVQFGCRLSLSAGQKYTLSMIRVGSAVFNAYGKDDEATSYYFEIVVSYNEEKHFFTVQLYCNRVLMRTEFFGDNPDRAENCAPDNVEIVLGPTGYQGHIFQQGVSGTMVVGDLYLATLPYGAGKEVKPELMGSIEVGACPVVAFKGDKHVNTLGKDVVKGLNSGAPADGYLSLRPVEQAAEITFEQPDLAGKKIIGVMVGVTYRSSSAPNNHLAWQMKQGTTPGPLTDEKSPQGDPGSWTTRSKMFTAPLDGTPEWDAGNLQFSLDLFNKTDILPGPQNQKNVKEGETET